jgi:hypothetical protein
MLSRLPRGALSRRQTWRLGGSASRRTGAGAVRVASWRGALSATVALSIMLTLAGGTGASAAPSDRSTGGKATNSTCEQAKAEAMSLGPGKVACVERMDEAPSSADARKWRQKVAAVGPTAVDCAVGEVTLNRFESCRLDFWRYEVVERPTGRILGTGTIAAGTTTELVRNSRTWQHHVRLGLLDATGVVIALTQATVTLDCSGTPGCVPVGGGTQWLNYPTQNQDFDFQVTSPGTAVSFHNPTPVVQLTNLAATEQAPPRRLDQAAQVRCDSTLGIGLGSRGGCVHPDYTPTYTLSTKDWRVDDVAWHIEWAQNNLQTAWGKKGSGPPLRRLTDRERIDDNRDAACPRSRPRPPSGDTCDEYPFASTYQGAALNPDFSWHWVEAGDNSREGGFGYRSKFYREQRILDFDAFWVHIVV